MIRIQGQKYQLAGYYFETNKSANLKSIFAVFAGKDLDIWDLPVDRSYKNQSDQKEAQRTFYIPMEHIELCSIAPECVIKNDIYGTDKILQDLGARQLSDVIKRSTRIPPPKTEPNKSYYVPAYGKMAV